MNAIAIIAMPTAHYAFSARRRGRSAKPSWLRRLRRMPQLPLAAAAVAPAGTAVPAPVHAALRAVGYPVGVVLDIVGINAMDQGRRCEERKI